MAEVYNAAMPGGRVTAETTPVDEANRLAWLSHHEPDRRPCWIGESGGARVGFVSLADFHPRPAYQITAEVSLYLHPDFQGKGFGEKMLAFAEGAAPSLGIETLVGLIYDSNTPSIALFSKRGFAIWGSLLRVARHTEGDRGLMLMGKRLVP